MLLWFVDKKATDLALKQEVLIEEEHVECQPERITGAIGSCRQNVDICLTCKYYSCVWCQAISGRSIEA